jgi:hypothetical protein
MGVRGSRSLRFLENCCGGEFWRESCGKEKQLRSLEVLRKLLFNKSFSIEKLWGGSSSRSMGFSESCKQEEVVRRKVISRKRL